MEPKNVLALIPGAPGQPIYDETLAEIRTIIRKGFNGPLNFYVEYLDTDRFPDPQHLRAQMDFLQRKFTKEKLDLLISFSPRTQRLIFQYPTPALDKVPTLFLKISTGLPSAPPIDRKPNATGIISEFQFPKTFEKALSLQTGTREAFIITGSSPFDRFLESAARVAYRHGNPSTIRPCWMQSIGRSGE